MVIRKSLQAIARCHLSVAAMAFFRAAAAKLKAFFSDKSPVYTLKENKTQLCNQL